MPASQSYNFFTMKHSSKSLSLSSSKCDVAELCLGNNLTSEELNWLDKTIQYVKTFKPGEHLFHFNDPVTHVFAILSGACKEYLIDMNGTEYVNEFYLEGDLIGLEYMEKGHYRLNAIAVKETIACLLPVHLIRRAKPFVQRRLFNILCQKLEHQLIYQQTTNAKQRAAAFYLDLIQRAKKREQNIKKIPVAITNADISHKIGIAHETLSRILHEFSAQSWLVIRQHQICSYDIEALKKIVGYIPVIS